MKQLLAATFLLATAQETGITLDLKNPQNVVAVRLEGTWTLRADLALRLAGTGAKELTFANDAKAVPEDVIKKLGARAKMTLTVSAMGWMKSPGRPDRPFLLTAIHGNPHLLWFRERNGDPFGDSESFNLMIAPGRDPKDDLLLVGGDFNNQPFSAFSRSK